MLQLGVIFGTGGRPSSKQWRGGTLYPSAASDQPTVVSATDRTACMGVQKAFMQLAGVTARWNPVTDPFDLDTANALGPLAHELRDQSRSATMPRFRVVFDRNAAALADLAAAMLSGNQPRVAAAVARSRNAYAALPRCARRGGHRPVRAQSAQPQLHVSSSG